MQFETRECREPERSPSQHKDPETRDCSPTGNTRRVYRQWRANKMANLTRSVHELFLYNYATLDGRIGMMNGNLCDG